MVSKTQIIESIQRFLSKARKYKDRPVARVDCQGYVPNPKDIEACFNVLKDVRLFTRQEDVFSFAIPNYWVLKSSEASELFHFHFFFNVDLKSGSKLKTAEIP